MPEIFYLTLNLISISFKIPLKGELLQSEFLKGILVPTQLISKSDNLKDLKLASEYLSNKKIIPLINENIIGEDDIQFLIQKGASAFVFVGNDRSISASVPIFYIKPEEYNFLIELINYTENSATNELEYIINSVFQSSMIVSEKYYRKHVLKWQLPMQLPPIVFMIILLSIWTKYGKDEELQRSYNFTDLPYASIKGSYIDSDICSVCHALFADLDMLRILACGHFFHADCIRTWLDRSHDCPLCRKNVYTPTVLNDCVSFNSMYYL
ncbi:hypothetical protein EDEG_02007 [Edhazardia aedis USNM 41457]|uniref:RING-type domain-containing protein n=1 Tax=Edhazardia aedis (strain USNM 41457) TaxID=1003232 RepID=J9DM50_EDHAE|nr:hypothetical protein EDEG_02007 [Edhazardia aedis USNM 41457]|eukprot:EJW03670.1 hypothetical protein EDEG_02007 [Edhazardia aedis USNM 41457]